MLPGGSHRYAWPPLLVVIAAQDSREMDSVETPAASTASATINDHTHHSSYRERLLEHILIGEMMRRLWMKGITHLEVLKPQVDDSGYDLVLEANSVIRHIQLKASHHGSATREIKVNLRLANKPSGGIIWMKFDPVTLELGPFLWFGSVPGEALPDISSLAVARHTKGNAKGVKSERPNIRLVTKSRFTPVENMDELIVYLFGEFITAEEAELSKQDRGYKEDQREAEVITACALRFNGYRYADEHGLVVNDSDYSLFVERLLSNSDFDLPRGHLHCALFLLQRAYIKEGLLRWDSREAKVMRELFLELCRDDVPEEYRNGEWCEEWERQYRPKLWRHLEFVRRRHERTKYQERSNE